MLKSRWKNLVLYIFLLLGSNVLIWNREAIAEFIGSKDDPGEVSVGILIHNSKLSGNDDKDIALAKSYLSEQYYWMYIGHCEVPLPFEIFKNRTGYGFQLIFKRVDLTPPVLQ